MFIFLRWIRICNQISRIRFQSPLGVTKGQNKKFKKKQQIWHIYVLNSVENDSECQKPKNPILIRFGYYLCRNDIQ